MNGCEARRTVSLPIDGGNGNHTENDCYHADFRVERVNYQKKNKRSIKACDHRRFPVRVFAGTDAGDHHSRRGTGNIFV